MAISLSIQKPKIGPAERSGETSQKLLSTPPVLKLASLDWGCVMLDKRIEQCERRLIVVWWALHGVVTGEAEPEKEEIDAINMLILDIQHDLREGLEASLKEMAQKMKVLEGGKS